MTNEKNWFPYNLIFAMKIKHCC